MTSTIDKIKHDIFYKLDLDVKKAEIYVNRGSVHLITGQGLTFLKPCFFSQWVNQFQAYLTVAEAIRSAHWSLA